MHCSPRPLPHHQPQRPRSTRNPPPPPSYHRAAAPTGSTRTTPRGDEQTRTPPPYNPRAPSWRGRRPVGARGWSARSPTDVATGRGRGAPPPFAPNTRRRRWACPTFRWRPCPPLRRHPNRHLRAWRWPLRPRGMRGPFRRHPHRRQCLPRRQPHTPPEAPPAFPPSTRGASTPGSSRGRRSSRAGTWEATRRLGRSPVTRCDSSRKTRIPARTGRVPSWGGLFHAGRST
mmetsp:Transcript_37968/g.81126  ORF Transcript_37968/g.81126 Transcript_37968/m.81126 type:complete len:230 (-) Transcript_37968:1625-2314(-)